MNQSLLFSILSANTLSEEKKEEYIGQLSGNKEVTEQFKVELKEFFDDELEYLLSVQEGINSELEQERKNLIEEDKKTIPQIKKLFSEYYEVMKNLVVKFAKKMDDEEKQYEKKTEEIVKKEETSEMDAIRASLKQKPEV